MKQLSIPTLILSPGVNYQTGLCQFNCTLFCITWDASSSLVHAVCAAWTHTLAYQYSCFGSPEAFFSLMPGVTPASVISLHQTCASALSSFTMTSCDVW